LPAGEPPRNMVDGHACWLETRLNNEPSTPLEYRKAKSSEQLRRGRSPRVEDHGRPPHRSGRDCNSAWRIVHEGRLTPRTQAHSWWRSTSSPS
jgi:hypothetical protein